VGVAQDRVAAEPIEAFDGLPDDRGAQVAHMHGLGDIGAAVVHEDTAGPGDHLGAQARVGGDLVGAIREGGVGDDEVDEAGTGDFHPKLIGL
jgi:hypothetical protein